MSKKAYLIFADYYDATTTSRRVMAAIKPIFDEIEFVYWARLGHERKNEEAIFSSVLKTVYKKTARPRSIGVLCLFVRFQFWIFRNLISRKPKFVIAFTFYTIFPALVYKYILNRKCKVIYDPRDYVSVSYRINKLISYSLNFVDNFFIKFSDFVIFPDKQYFIYYGKFKLRDDKYFILPNSAEDLYEEIEKIDIYQKYNLPKDKNLIPILGYFSETRGERVLFDLIKEKDQNLHFVVAGDIRDEVHLNFFEAHKENVSYLNKIPYLDALAVIKESLLVPQLYDPQLLNNVYAYPTKYYDCLMVGTPMVVSDGQIDVYQEIIAHNLGFGINYNDLQGLRTIIDDLVTNRKKIDRNALRHFFLLKYDYNIYKQKLREVYSKLQ
jgi:glycosyltransferase involved in cell wall biosynthesis